MYKKGDIDKLDELPFRQNIIARWERGNIFSTRLRKRWNSAHHYYYHCGVLIANSIVENNVGKPINKAYSEFRHKTKAPSECFYRLFCKEHDNGYGYDVVDGIITYEFYHRKWRKKRPVKSTYKTPELVQVRAEKRQQEKRNLRLRKLALKNRQYDFRTLEQEQIDKLVSKFKGAHIPKLDGFTLSIVRINKPIYIGTILIHLDCIKAVHFPDKLLKQGYFTILTDLVSEMQKCTLIKTLQ